MSTITRYPKSITDLPFFPTDKDPAGNRAWGYETPEQYDQQTQEYTLEQRQKGGAFCYPRVLRMAIVNGNLPLIQHVVDRALKEAPLLFQEYSLLFFAVHDTLADQETRRKMVALLLEKGVSPNRVNCKEESIFSDGKGISPLYWAAAQGDKETARLLLSHGALPANLDAEDRQIPFDLKAMAFVDSVRQEMEANQPAL